MVYKTKFLELAIQELEDTKEYYDYQQEGLGSRFIVSVYKTIQLIENHPNAWHQVTPRTRRCLIKNFPYGIVYQLKNNCIFIIAIANLHRKPNYWIDRIT